MSKPHKSSNGSAGTNVDPNTASEAMSDATGALGGPKKSTTTTGEAKESRQASPPRQRTSDSASTGAKASKLAKEDKEKAASALPTMGAGLGANAAIGAGGGVPPPSQNDTGTTSSTSHRDSSDSTGAIVPLSGFSTPLDADAAANSAIVSPGRSEVHQDATLVDFSEPDTAQNIVYAEDGSVKGATLAKLVQKLTSSSAHVSQLFDFLATYRMHTTPRYLVALLRRRFEQVVEGEDIKPVRLRVVNFMRQWIEKHTYDWVDDPEMFSLFSKFIDSWVDIDSSNAKASALCSGILKKAIEPMEKEKKKAQKIFAASPPAPEIPTEQDPTKLQFRQISTTELARQWTLLDWHLWEAIKPWEFLNCNWNRKRKEELAPNIVALTKSFNRAAGWVSTLIVKTQTLKERVKVIKKFIDLAEELRALGNFNGVMQIISGLGNASIYRLKHSWDALPKQSTDLYEQLTGLMANNGSFRRYREHLKQVNPPTIPYLGISLTDLTFIYEGSRDSTSDGLINFTKCKCVAEIIKSVMQYQQTSYHFVTVPVIRDYIKYPTIWDDSTIWNYSLFDEPRQGSPAPDTEPPSIVLVSETPSSLSQKSSSANLELISHGAGSSSSAGNGSNSNAASSNATASGSHLSSIPIIDSPRYKIIKEPPFDWKSPKLVIRKGSLRAADLHHACLHLLYIPDHDSQYTSFTNVFYNSIKSLGGLEKIFETFEAILQEAPLSDPPLGAGAAHPSLLTSNNSLISQSSAPNVNTSSASPRSSSKKLDIPSLSPTTASASANSPSSSPRGPGDGIQKSASTSSISPRSSGIEEETDNSSKNGSKASKNGSSDSADSSISLIEVSSVSSPSLDTKAPRRPKKSNVGSSDAVSGAGAEGENFSKPSSGYSSSTLRGMSTTSKGKHRRTASNTTDIVVTDDMIVSASAEVVSSKDSTNTSNADQQPYMPQKTKKELAKRILEACILWGTRYSSMVGPNRDTKALQQLQAWMDQKLSQTDGMKDTVQSATASFMRTLPMLTLEATRRSSGAAMASNAPKSHPNPTSMPIAQQNIRLYHPEEISRQFALWAHSEFVGFSKDEFTLLSAYSSKSSGSTTNIAANSGAGANANASQISPGSSASASTPQNGIHVLSSSISKWIKQEIRAASTDSSAIKKKLIPLFEHFVEVLAFSLEMSNYLVAHSIFTSLHEELSPTLESTVLEQASKKAKESWASQKSLFLDANGAHWHKRIAASLLQSQTSANASVDVPMTLPAHWLDSAIAHNQTERDWWKGRNSIFSFDKLAMVSQTWKSIERVTRTPYSFLLVPMLKDFLVAGILGDTKTQISNSNGANASASNTSSSSLSTTATSNVNQTTSTAQKDTSKKSKEGKSGATEELNVPIGQESPRITSTSSMNASNSDSAIVLQLGKDKEGAKENAKTASSKEAGKRPSTSSASSSSSSSAPAQTSTNSKSSRITASYPEIISPRSSRGGSASSTASSQDSSMLYGNTPEFRSAVTRMLGEDEDFRTSVISILASMGLVAPAPPTSSSPSPSPSPSNPTSRSSPSKIRRKTSAPNESNKIAALEAEVARLKRLTANTAVHLTDSDSSDDEA